MKFFINLFGAILLLGLFGGVAGAVNFDDIGDSDYKESIEVLADRGIVNGYEGGTFRPESSVNRAELLKIVFQSLDETTGEYAGDCFPDVKQEWFAPFVCKAKDAGIVNGYGDGMYRPAQNVNMVEGLKIVLTAYDMPLPEAEEGDQWYEPYVNFAHTNNIFSKFAYLSDRPMRREEVAFLVHQVLKVKEGDKVVQDERNIKSEGCGQTAPSVAPVTFIVDGIQRSAITVIPQGYNSNMPVSLIFAFHGRTNSNQMVKGYYGIEKPTNGKAIIVYPAGLQAGSGYSWSDGNDVAGALRDYEFFDVMYEEFLSSYCINVDEVYAVGHSLGGWFTNSLGCARGDVLRGVASLGGSRTNSKCTGPVAAMQWHNPRDQLASYASAVVARDQFVAQNQCSQSTEAVAPFWGNCVIYKGCNEYAPMVWCPHTQDYDSRGQYYTHNWPKGTGEEMWKFLSELKD